MNPGRTSRVLGLLLIGLAACTGSAAVDEQPTAPKPNILFCIADDWGWPHAGAYGDPVVKTPTFDRLAREGVLFEQAYISSPSCTPSRSAILTGQQIWRLEESANLWSTLQTKFAVYPDLLEEAGYHVGYSRKGWGPGRHQVGGRKRNAAGDKYKNFNAFLAKRPEGKPFCFWFGSTDPHRGYKKGSGKASGMKLEEIRLFDFFPDNLDVRGDVADYYWEVQRFDREVGARVAKLREMGELENTIVVMTGDHGMPFPRCKGNLYDSGARVPLAIRWPEKISTPGRRVTDFVSLTDLAPTFLAAAGIETPGEMTGRSLLPILESDRAGRVEVVRDHVLTGKERHVPCQEAPLSGGTPMRAIRTDDFLYIRNFKPDRWPAGTPNDKKAWFKRAWLGDCDNGPTKSSIVALGNTSTGNKYYQWSFGKRPAEELYDVRKDPGQLKNVADDPAYSEMKSKLWTRLETGLRNTRDPRIIGGAEKFDTYPYYGGTPRR